MRSAVKNRSLWMKKAFSLIELIIVAAVLGILASIVIPQLQGHTTQARETAALDALAMLRTQIEMYKIQHGGAAPGYTVGPLGLMPSNNLVAQLENTTTVRGGVSSSKTPSTAYPCGPYVTSFPKNPFNGKSDVTYLASGAAFTADDKTGWLYQRETADIRLNKTDSDNSGKAYVEY